jgi:hypothetical protein
MNAKPLSRIKTPGLHWIDDAGKRHQGNCSGLWGNCSSLWGDCSGLRGDCSGLWGNCSSLWGDCSGIPFGARPCGLTDWTEEP